MDDERPKPDLVGDEATLLTQFLDHHRASIVWKSQGLDPAGVAVCPGPTDMSIGGLLKHLTLVEDHWFDYCFAGNDKRQPWAAIDWDADPDWEWRTGANDPLNELLANYLAACERSRRITSATADFDQLSVRPARPDQHVSLRWVLLHMLEETARHVGHVDMIRETIDGFVGE